MRCAAASCRLPVMASRTQHGSRGGRVAARSRDALVGAAVACMGVYLWWLATSVPKIGTRANSSQHLTVRTCQRSSTATPPPNLGLVHPVETLVLRTLSVPSVPVPSRLSCCRSSNPLICGRDFRGRTWHLDRVSVCCHHSSAVQPPSSNPTPLYCVPRRTYILCNRAYLVALTLSRAFRLFPHATPFILISLTLVSPKLDRLPAATRTARAAPSPRRCTRSTSTMRRALR